MIKTDTKTLTTLGVLLAMEIVLARFLSISAWNIRVGFSFVPVAIAAIVYGPVAGAVVAGLGDFLGAILFPMGPYFPGFTVTAVLTGAVYGLFLHKKISISGIVGAVGINQLILSLFLNSLWISILYGSPYVPLLGTRIIQCAILVPVQFIVIHTMGRLKILRTYREIT